MRENLRALGTPPPGRSRRSQDKSDWELLRMKQGLLYYIIWKVKKGFGEQIISIGNSKNVVLNGR